MDRQTQSATPPVPDSSSLIQKMFHFQQSGKWRSIHQLANSLVPYAFLWVAMYYVLQYSVWLAIPIAVLAAGFLVRIFVIFHDCGHGSFFKSKRANDVCGVLTGILTFTPYHYWRASHARHHATSGNLDKRGHGDVWMMTVEEYAAASTGTRLQYRLYRNPAVMFLLGPLFLLLISYRIPKRRSSRSEKLSVHATNAGIILLAFLISLVIGFKTYLLIQLPIIFIAFVAGVWLFYVQHQFESVNWTRQSEWDFISASLYGGSFYKLPKILNWFTGSIGYHHVHHVNPRIPNYNLAKCHRHIDDFRNVISVGLISGLKAFGYRLWDEKQKKLIGFGTFKTYQFDPEAN